MKSHTQLWAISMQRKILQNWKHQIYLQKKLKYLLAMNAAWINYDFFISLVKRKCWWLHNIMKMIDSISSWCQYWTTLYIMNTIIQLETGTDNGKLCIQVKIKCITIYNGSVDIKRVHKDLSELVYQNAWVFSLLSVISIYCGLIQWSAKLWGEWH